MPMWRHVKLVVFALVVSPALADDAVTLDRHSDSVNTVAFSKDGEWLASAGDDNTIILWNASARTVKTTFKVKSTVRVQDKSNPKVSKEIEPEAILSIAFSPDGKLLASAGSDKLVRIWSVSTGKVVHTLKGHTDQVNGVAFSPDGKLLASASDDQTARLWSVA